MNIKTSPRVAAQLWAAQIQGVPPEVCEIFRACLEESINEKLREKPGKMLYLGAVYDGDVLLWKALQRAGIKIWPFKWAQMRLTFFFVEINEGQGWRCVFDTL